jgi:hypothetical protein
MKLIRRAIILMLALMISGCTMTGSTSFRDMSSSYRDVLEG